MHRKGLLVGFLAGAMTVVALMIVFSIREDIPRAAAQEVSPTLRPGQEAPPAQAKTETVEIRAVPVGQAPAAAVAPRYQIDAWNTNLGHGAYVLDTQSGEVWHISEAGRPKKLGKAGPE
jgi:hypothetical protein